MLRERAYRVPSPQISTSENPLHFKNPSSSLSGTLVYLLTLTLKRRRCWLREKQDVFPSADVNQGKTKRFFRRELLEIYASSRLNWSPRSQGAFSKYCVITVCVVH